MQFIQLKRYERFLRVEDTGSLWLQIADLLSLQQLFEVIMQPEQNKTLVCIHARRNELDAFSVKTVPAVDNATVGHLTREIPVNKVFT